LIKEPTMTRIQLSKLRTLLQRHQFPAVGVRASLHGGWFIQRAV
jgi:hypothetical protein